MPNLSGRNGYATGVLHPISTDKRFWVKVVKTETCWFWIGAKTGSGYGTIRHQGRTVLAHRYAYELLVGSIPERLGLDHLCRVRDCVNPAHLEPVTTMENIHRGLTGIANNHNARKTHCLRGHPFDEGNTQLQAHGWRRCRACKKIREARSVVTSMLRTAQW